MASSSRAQGFGDDVLKLNFANLKLYGRSSELASLKDAYQSVHVVGDNETLASTIVMVHGYSGTGKSTLVHELKKELVPQGGFFCAGKYQQLRGTEPFSALANAFRELCEAIVDCKDKEPVSKIQSSLTTTEILVLIKVLPVLRPLLGETFSEQLFEKESVARDGTVGKTEALNQLKFAFRTFARAVAGPTHPVVLFLDDLQWADVASLDLIKFIVTDPSSRNFLFVGAYRDNEVTNGIHPLALFIRDVEKEKDVLRIKLENLTEHVVNQLISDVTRLNVETTAPLTAVVHQKTHGNIFFVLQLLDHLQQHKLLYYNLAKYEWNWDMDRIMSETDISDNVVQLVASKIKRLDETVQSVVKLASCLWLSFDSNLLSILFSEIHENEEVDVMAILEHAVSEGLLEKRGAGQYKFSHDRVQQAAYSLIPEGQDRELYHLEIGEHLQKLIHNQAVLEGISKSRSEWISFVAADQLNRGSNHIEDPRKRTELAKLNLLTGTKAVNMSAYVPALVYLKSGVAMLDEKKKWEEHYELSLDLLSTAAEVAHAVGSFDESVALSKEVLAHARSNHDKVRVQICVAESLTGKERFEDAFDFVSLLLTERGRRMPKKLLSFPQITLLVKAKKRLKNMSDEDIMNLPIMMDDDKIAAIRFLNLFGRVSWFLQRTDEMVLAILHQVNLTVRHGLSRYSPEVFMGYGMIHSALGDIQAGGRFDQLARKLIDKIHSKEVESAVLGVSAIFLSHWVLPLQDCLPQILEGHRIGMEYGNVEQAMASAAGYILVYFAAGLPLGPWESDTSSFCRQMVEYKWESVHSVILPVYQCGLNIMGRALDSPLVLTGDAMDQDEFVRTIEASNNKAAKQSMWFVRAQLGYYFDDMDLAAEMIAHVGRTADGIKGHVIFFLYLFLNGLISTEMYRRTRKRAFKSRALASIKSLKKLASRGGVNCVPKVLVLQADYSAAASVKNRKKKRREKVKLAFDKAISVASRSGFLQDAALANERAGLFFLHTGVEDDRFWISSYLSRAHELYSEWGATGKADHLQTHMGSLFNVADTKFGSACKAVPRFDVSTGTKNRKLVLDKQS